MGEKKLNIIIISSMFPPLQTPRAFRTFELAKELSRLSHNVTVYSVLGKYDYTNLMRETGIKIMNLGKSHFGNIDSTGKFSKNIFYRAITRFFGKYIEFPRIELYFKVKKTLKKILRNPNNIDLLITIAYPFAIHWGAAAAKKKDIYFPKWISDCGDPFMGNSFEKHPFYFKYIEKWWCRKTDYISVPIKNAINAYYKEFRNKIVVIPQGFNFTNPIKSNYKKNNISTFIYSGNIYPKLRDPETFLKYLCLLDYDFKFIVYTNTKEIFLKYKNKLGDKIEINNFIPRNDLLEILSCADFLINIKNSGSVQTPSKLIDYYLSKRPILEISTEFKEKNEFTKFLHSDYSNKLKNIDISYYNIKNVAKNFLDI